MRRPGRSLLLVLHSHLPWVLHHGRWPHGSDWLCEAVAESYLPLWRVLSARARRSRPVRVTLSLSPVLCEQLAHPDFAGEFRAYLDIKHSAAREDRLRFAAGRRTEEAGLARRWERFYRATLEEFFGPHGTNLVARFRRLEEQGAIEIITSAATHGYLPLLGTAASVERQIGIARVTHRRHFGRDPRGMWIPECAYRPGGPWRSPVESDRDEPWRPGVDEPLAGSGFEYFFVDEHLVAGGEPIGVASEFATARVGPASFARTGFTPSGAFRVEPSGLACFARDRRTAEQVWSRIGGYPGDAEYLEFHKRNHPGGLRYWAVTDPHSDLAGKRLYRPRVARARVAEHARHLLESLRPGPDDHRADSHSPVCALYDTELFGHWWFEGPEFLGALLDRAPGQGLTPETAGQFLDRKGTHGRARLFEGSWGEGGDHRVWLQPSTHEAWRSIHDLERRFERLAIEVARASSPLAGRAMAQALRELLLLESSDWTFLITRGTAADYAEARWRGHARDAAELLKLASRSHAGAPVTAVEVERLAACEARDSLFQGLDWRAGLSPASILGEGVPAG